MVEFVDRINRRIQRLYYPPCPSKYNPIERCWGILEQHWNGSKLVDVEAMLSWASSMTWKGLHPILILSNIVYQKGISLTKKAMKPRRVRIAAKSIFAQMGYLDSTSLAGKLFLRNHLNDRAESLVERRNPYSV